MGVYNWRKLNNLCDQLDPLHALHDCPHWLLQQETLEHLQEMEGLGDELVQPTLLLLQAGRHLTATLVPTAAGYPGPLGCSPLPPVHGPPQRYYYHNLFGATTIKAQVNQC
jgi:hypothetical protein